MKKLLEIEYIKLKNLSSLKVILAIYVIMVPLVMYFLSDFYMSFIHPIIPILKDLWGFPTVWNFTTYSSSYFNLLMGITVVIIVCNEYNFKTFKQNIIDGLSPKEVIVSKFLVVFGLSTVVTIYTALLSIVLGVINSGASAFFEESYHILIYYLQTLCYFSFAFFFAVLVRKTALSIILFIVSFIAEAILGVFVSLVATKELYLYFPLNAFSKLTPNPLMEELNKMAAQQSGQTEPSLPMWLNIIICLVYMSLFFFVAYKVLKKRDL